MSVKIRKGIVVVEEGFTLDQLPLLRAKARNRVELELWRLSLTDLEFLVEFVGLTDVKIYYCKIDDASALRDLPALRSLFINGARFKSGLDFLGNLPVLEELDLLNFRGTFTVPSLSGLGKLSRFRAWGCKGFTDVAAVAAAPNIDQVNLVDTNLEPDSLMPLLQHDTLSALTVTFATQAKTRVFEGMLEQYGKDGYPR